MPVFRALVNRIRRTQLPQRLHLRRPRVNAETTLDGLYTTCKLLGAVADGVANVPALKGAASLTKEIVNIAQMAQQNKEGCVELSQQVTEYMYVVEHTCKPEVGEAYRRNVERFCDELTRTKALMHKLAARRWFSRLWRHELDKRKIEEAKERLEHAFKRFDLTGSILVYQSCQRTEISVEAIAVKVDRVLAVQLFFFN